MRITESTETRVAFARGDVSQVIFYGFASAGILCLWGNLVRMGDDRYVVHHCAAVTCIVPLTFLWYAFFEPIELRVTLDRTLGMVLFERRFLLRSARRWARPLEQVVDVRFEARPSGRGGWGSLSLVLAEPEQPLKLVEGSIGRGEVEEIQRCGAALQAFVRSGREGA